MKPDALKEAFDEMERQIKEAVEAGEDPDKAADRIIPRMFYNGHRVIHGFKHPDKRAKWECYSCKHQWISKHGVICPACKNCRHEWYDKPEGKVCGDCGIAFEDRD